MQTKSYLQFRTEQVFCFYLKKGIVCRKELNTNLNSNALIGLAWVLSTIPLLNQTKSDVTAQVG